MKKLKAILSDAGRASRLLAAGLAVFVAVSFAYAATNYTTYTNLKITALTLLQGAVSMSSTLAVTGDTTLSTTTLRLRYSLLPSSAVVSVGITPLGTGDLVYNGTDKEVCVATGALRTQWVKISTPSAACGH